MQQLSRRAVLQALGATGVTTVSGCAGDTVQSEADEFVRAVWVFPNEIDDLGWAWAHNEGLRSVARELEWVRTDSAVDIKPAESEEIFREYVDRDYDIIFGCTFEYQDHMRRVAADAPDTYFEHCTGYVTRENMGRYMGRIYQARYLAGQAAGLLTETDLLGYVAAKSITEVIRGINAYALGVASVNSSATIRVQYTDSWYDPDAETEAATKLISEGVDVMAQHQNSAAAVTAAREANIWATGYNSSMATQGGVHYITSPIWHWDNFYIPTVRAVRNNSWESDFYWKGLASGICSLDDWGPQVPAAVKDTVAGTRQDIINGDRTVWDNSKFASVDDSFLFQEMDSYVPNIEVVEGST